MTTGAKFMPTEGVTPKRKRLSSLARRMQLLNCAGNVIQDRGLSGLTIEALATEARVSIPLIYKYFGTRLQILQELLTLRSTVFDKALDLQVKKAGNYSDFVTLVVTASFEQFADNNIMIMLRGQKDVYERRTDAEKTRRKASHDSLLKNLSECFFVDREKAEDLLVFLSMASQAAATHYNQHGGNRAQMIDNTVCFVLGGIQALRAK